MTPPEKTRLPSDSATRVNTRITSSPRIPSGPLGNISNKVQSTSTDEAMSRLDSNTTARKPSRITTATSDGSSSHDNNEVHSRIGSRNSLSGRRSISGAKAGPSAFRRLPPGVAPRSVVPSLNGSDDHVRDRVASGSRPTVAALARVNQAASGPRRSLGASINAAANGSMAQHDREVREVAKLNVDSSSFEEWMKMATDNKINATNTWNFALIDYFHDMSLLRSENGDGSINFQKASCTLDGCVKVWTSRVDSVVVETGKLLSGLQDDGKESNSKSSRAKAGEENDEDGADEEDENGTLITKKKKSRAREPTLAKSFAQLAVKKLDLEFTVDPLFKKTSADFDEGGAGGLLMNHLGVDSNARVVFDAGDVAGVGDDEQEEVLPLAEEAEGDAAEESQVESSTFADQVDLLKIRNKLFSQFDGLELGDEDALGSLLSDLVICPTFSSFRFAPGDNTPFSALAADNVDSALPAYTQDYLPAPEEYDGEDDFQMMPAFDDDGQEDAFGSADPFGGGPTGYEYNGQDFDDGGLEMTGQQMVIPSDAPIDFATAFQGITDEQGVNLNGDGFFDYFDQRLTKNWAGPEHWKMRNIGMGPAPAQKGDTSTGNGEKGARKSKEAFVVDFCSEEGAVLAKTLFESPKHAAAILLPAQRDATVIDNFLLPEDRHFTSRQLLRLFIKPRAMLNLKRKGVIVMGEAMQEGVAHQADVDEAFWAQQAAAREGSNENGPGPEYADAEGGMAPFFQFGDDDGGFDAMDDGAEVGMELDVVDDDEELATQALKRIRPEFVNYAKKAKRVDVRKLKENIWKQLAIEAEKDDSAGSEDGDEEADQSATPKVGKLAARVSESLEPRVFQSVLSGLRKTYPKDRMDEISTSFCFICLLHLANEEGLQIKTAEGQEGGILGKLSQMTPVVDDEEDDELGEDCRGEERVGFLEQLSIVKDPNAGRSA